jgi:uncharacterized membrane protein
MCVLKADSSDPTGSTFLVKPAGTVAVKINSLTGTVIFNQKTTSVTDSSGKQVAGTSFPTPDTYSFPTKAGQTYTQETGYFCFPPNATGTLNEDCPGGVKLADILSTTNAQIFTIKA